MSGIVLADLACLAGQRDWRRITVGTDGSGRYGFAGAPIGSYGSINVQGYQGHNILFFGSQSSGTNFEIILAGVVAQSFFNFIEVGLSNGQSRIFYTNAASAFSNPASTNSQWDWNSLPAGYTWGSGDNGSVRFIGIG